MPRTRTGTSPGTACLQSRVVEPVAVALVVALACVATAALTVAVCALVASAGGGRARRGRVAGSTAATTGPSGADADSVRGVLTALPLGAVLLDADDRVVAVNEAGRRLAVVEVPPMTVAPSSAGQASSSGQASSAGQASSSGQASSRAQEPPTGDAASSATTGGGVAPVTGDVAVELRPLVRRARAHAAEVLLLAGAAREDPDGPPATALPTAVADPEVLLARRTFRREPVMVTARAVALPGGGVVVLVSDRTEASRLERVRQDFVAALGHELKTPVGALLLLAEQVVERAEDPASVVRYGRRAADEARRLGRLVTEMVDLARLEGAEAPPARHPVELDRVVAEAVDRVRTVAEARSIRIAVAGERGVVVPGVSRHLTTAVANLVDNAVVYSPDDSQVTVAVRVREDVADVVVSDSGVGLSAADAGRVFERFFRADRGRSRPDGSTGGNGLGLAIVKHVAENHGGTVTLWSVPGSGSTFTLRLPAAEGAVVPSAAPAAPASCVAISSTPSHGTRTRRTPAGGGTATGGTPTGGTPTGGGTPPAGSTRPAEVG